MTTQLNRKPRRSKARQAAFTNMMNEMYRELLIATKDDPVEHAKVVQMGLADATPEQRLAGSTPEQRLAGLEPEQLAATLSPEQRKKLLELLSQPTPAKDTEES